MTPNIPTIEALSGQLTEVIPILREEAHAAVDKKGGWEDAREIARRAEEIELFAELAPKVAKHLLTGNPPELQTRIDKIMRIQRGRGKGRSTTTRRGGGDPKEKAAILKAIALVAKTGADLGHWSSNDTDTAYALVCKEYPDVARRRIPSNVKVVKAASWQAILAEYGASETEQSSDGEHHQQLPAPAAASATSPAS